MSGCLEFRGKMDCEPSRSPWRRRVRTCSPNHAASPRRQPDRLWRPEESMAQVTAPAKYKSPLHEMTQTTPTCLWNDSASIQELSYSLEHGAVGATCNPVIVVGILKKEIALWKDRIHAVIDENAAATEDEISWRLVREISTKSAALLEPAFDVHHGRNGRLSIQTDPRLYRNTTAMLEQAQEYD